MVINQKYDNYILDLYDRGYKLTWNGLKKTHHCIFSYLSNRFDDNCKKISEVIYRIRCGLNSHPICPVCGNLVKFVDKTCGYKVYCSQECKNSDKGKQLFNIKVKHTCIDKYGVENVFQSGEVKEKCKYTCLQRYGYNNSFVSLFKIKDNIPLLISIEFIILLIISIVSIEPSNSFISVS